MVNLVENQAKDFINMEAQNKQSNGTDDFVSVFFVVLYIIICDYVFFIQ